MLTTEPNNLRNQHLRVVLWLPHHVCGRPPPTHTHRCSELNTYCSGKRCRFGFQHHTAAYKHLMHMCIICRHHHAHTHARAQLKIMKRKKCKHTTKIRSKWDGSVSKYEYSALETDFHLGTPGEVEIQNQLHRTVLWLRITWQYIKW